MSAEGLAGTIFGMLALDASDERIIRIIERALAEERAAERARMAHTYSDMEYASGFAAEDIAALVVGSFTGDEYWIDKQAAAASIAAALRAYGAACAAEEKERCVRIAQVVGTAHTYSEAEYLSGFAAANIVTRIVAVLADPPNSPIPAATRAAMRYLARFVLDDVTQQLPVGVIAAADHLYCLARDQPGV